MSTEAEARQLADDLDLPPHDWETDAPPDYDADGAAPPADATEYMTHQRQTDDELARFRAGKATKERKPRGRRADAQPHGDGGGQAVETTDAVLAGRVAEQLLRGHYCWSAGLGWQEWTGTHWQDSTAPSVIERVRLYMVDKVGEKLKDPSTDWRKRQELMALLGRGRLVSLVELAKGILQVPADAFDSHPDLLNVLNGVVDLRTSEIRPHDPELYLTKITPVAYRPGAEHDDWISVLGALPPTLWGWWQIRMGQAATGYMTPDDTMLILQGGGKNGKSTVMEAIACALGSGYSVLMSDRVLLAEPGQHPTEMMDLRGARHAMAEELPEDRRLNVKRLKDVVGTPTMKARRMKADPVEWKATHSLMISTNYLPAIQETDHGTWRRLCLVKFPYTYTSGACTSPEHRRGDPGIRERIKNGRAQQEAVLAWIIEGARQWYELERVLPEHPEQVQRDTQEWRARCDLILAYHLDRIEPDPESHVLSNELYEDFNSFLKAHGHPPWSDKLFGARFEGHDQTSAGQMVRKKIRARAGLSRPPLDTSAWNAPMRKEPGASYRAWLGVKFAPAGGRVDDVEE